MRTAAAGPVPVAESGTVALRRVLLNAAALFAAYVLPRALTFAAALVAARALGPNAFGAYGTAASLAMIFSIFASLGMLPLLVRELARAPERAAELLAAAHVLKLVAGAGMVAALGVCARLLGMSTTTVWAAVLLGAGHALWTVAENFGALLQSRERLRIWLEANIVFGVVSGVLAATAVLLTRSVPWFCAGFAAGQGAALLYLLVRLPPLPRTHQPGRVTGDVLRLARAALPFAVAFFALTVFYKFDVLLLDRLQGSVAAGVYAAGYKLVDVVHALAVVASAAVYPRLARAATQDAARRTVELFLLIAVPAAASIWLIRTPLVALLFGAEYADTAVALGLLAPAAGVLAVNILFGYLLGVADRAGLLALCYAIGVAAKLVFGLLWMPVAGAAGAAAAMLASELLLSGTLVIAVTVAGVALPRARPVALAAFAVAWAVACGMFATSIGAALLLFILGVTTAYIAGGALSTAERAAVRGVLALSAPAKLDS